MLHHRIGMICVGLEVRLRLEHSLEVVPIEHCLLGYSENRDEVQDALGVSHENIPSCKDPTLEAAARVQID